MRHYFDDIGWPKRYLKPLSARTRLQIVIPAYKETGIIETLASLVQCKMKEIAEVIVVVNGRQNDTNEVKKINADCYQSVILFRNDSEIEIHAIYEPELPNKHAGAGLARKIGMDEAAYRFTEAGRNGVIVCLDSDCTVDNNYFEAIDYYFTNTNSVGASIYFEHQTPDDAILDQGIVNYELHLRCYIQGLRFSGYPFAYHTVGSSMAVKSKTYIEQGGMNRRKAGEDFYFLQKIMQLYRFGDINSTRVMPSSRVSDRVPFGTGKAQSEATEGRIKQTYHPDSYLELRSFMAQINHGIETVDLTGLPKMIGQYLLEAGAMEALTEARKNTADPDKLKRRFFHWFNGLRALQYFHYAREHGRTDVDTDEVTRWIIEKRWSLSLWDLKGQQLLDKIRELERSDLYQII